MRKSDTNANVLPPKSPWCSQWKLILNFPPPVPRGRGSPAASPFPDSQVVTLPAAAAGHRLSSERGCAGRRAPDSGTGHLHAPRGQGPASGSCLGLCRPGVLLTPAGWRVDQGQKESCSRPRSWAAPCPHRGTVASRALCQGVGCLDAWTPRWAQGRGHAVCSDWVSGTRGPEAPTDTARPASSLGFLCALRPLLNVHVSCGVGVGGRGAGAPAFPGAAVTGRAARRPRPFPDSLCVR